MLLKRLCIMNWLKELTLFRLLTLAICSSQFSLPGMKIVCFPVLYSSYLPFSYPLLLRALIIEDGPVTLVVHPSASQLGRYSLLLVFHLLKTLKIIIFKGHVIIRNCLRPKKGLLRQKYKLRFLKIVLGLCKPYVKKIYVI